MPEMIGMCRKCLAGQLLNRLDWCESFNPMFCIKCRLIRQRIDGRNVPACSVIYGHRLISGPKEFIYLILTPTATNLTHLTSNETRRSLALILYLVFVSNATNSISYGHYISITLVTLFMYLCSQNIVF